MTKNSPPCIYCQYLQKELPALERPPLPGEQGQWIYLNISAQAWRLWTIEQVKFINEHRLSLNKPEDKKALKDFRAKFLGLPEK